MSFFFLLLHKISDLKGTILIYLFFFLKMVGFHFESIIALYLKTEIRIKNEMN